MAVYDWTEYNRISYPATDGAEPDRIYYQETYPNGTIWPWPYPEDTATALANKLEIFTWAYLSSWATADTSIDLAPGYKDAITWALAERLTVPFGLNLSNELKNQARMAMASVASVNLKARKISMDYGIPQSEGYG